MCHFIQDYIDFTIFYILFFILEFKMLLLHHGFNLKSTLYQNLPVPHDVKTLLNMLHIWSVESTTFFFGCLMCPFLILIFLLDIWFSLYLVGQLYILVHLLLSLLRRIFFNLLLSPSYSFIYYFHLVAAHNLMAPHVCHSPCII